MQTRANISTQISRYVYIPKHTLDCTGGTVGLCRPHLISCWVVLWKESRIKKESREREGGRTFCWFAAVFLRLSSFFSLPLHDFSPFIILWFLSTAAVVAAVFSLHVFLLLSRSVGCSLSLFSVTPSFNLAPCFYLSHCWRFSAALTHFPFDPCVYSL